jgi:hypothetical protein
LPNIATAIAFVKLCQPIKNPVLTSYGLKHVAERWGERNGMEPYVANGEFIVAAIYLGVPVKPIELGRVNRRARTFIAAEDPSQLRWG